MERWNNKAAKIFQSSLRPKERMAEICCVRSVVIVAAEFRGWPNSRSKGLRCCPGRKEYAGWVLCTCAQPTIGSFCPAKKRMTAQQDALHSAASHFLKCLSERQSKASEKRKKGSQKQISRARTADEKGEEEKRRDLFFFAELTLSFASKSCRLFMCWFYLNFPGDFGNVLFIWFNQVYSASLWSQTSPSLFSCPSNKVPRLFTLKTESLNRFGNFLLLLFPLFFS